MSKEADKKGPVEAPKSPQTDEAAVVETPAAKSGIVVFSSRYEKPEVWIVCSRTDVKDGVRLRIPGMKAQFEDFQYSVDPEMKWDAPGVKITGQNVVDAIRKCRMFGKDIFEYKETSKDFLTTKDVPKIITRLQGCNDSELKVEAKKVGAEIKSNMDKSEIILAIVSRITDGKKGD